MTLLDELLLPPNEAQKAIIQLSIGEDDERFENNLKIFKKWIECEPHLPKNYDENMLSVFLRGCKHDMEHAKRKLELFFLCRLTLPEFFLGRDVSDPSLKSTIDNVCIVPLPNLTPAGNRVSCFAMKHSDVAQFDIAAILKYSWILGDIRACKEKMIGGDVFIFDCQNFTALHVTKFINPLVRKTLFVLQEAYPSRTREIHLINAPSYMETVVTFVKLALKEKIRERFNVHKDVSTLKDYVPVEFLPEEWGGSAGSIIEMNEKWIKCLSEEAGWLKQQENVKCFGELPKNLKDKSSNFEETIGVAGSFRKLTID